MQSNSLEKDDVFSSFRYSWWHIYVSIVMLLSLLGKMIILFTGKRSEVSCFLVEFLLRWCPISCEWLNVCVALERTIAVKYFGKYSHVKSLSAQSLRDYNVKHKIAVFQLNPNKQL